MSDVPDLESLKQEAEMGCGKAVVVVVVVLSGEGL